MIGAQIATVASRTAANIWPSLLTRTETTKREVVLTLDDGPSPATARILDELDIPIAWFVLGCRIEEFPDGWEALLAASRAPDQRGIVIANHSFNHLDGWRVSSDRHADDLTQGLKVLEECGVTSRWTRPPFGRIRPATMQWAADHRHQIVLCDLLAGDYGRSNRATAVANEVAKAVRPGSIVAMHDKDLSSVETLVRTVETLDRGGWSFAPLSPRRSLEAEPA